MRKLLVRRALRRLDNVACEDRARHGANAAGDRGDGLDDRLNFGKAGVAAEVAVRADVVLSTVSRDQLLAGGQFSSHVTPDFVVEALFLLLFASNDDAREHARMERKSLGKDKESMPTFS